MEELNFSLSWSAYQKDICKGLSSLQQNGELVDMTLAADGHHVKVHQLVMSLVSPYIKDLISTAKCSHPIIFLNQMSYKTLAFILEYIYTGEVNISKDKLDEFVQAAKALHIKGLEDMNVSSTIIENDSPSKMNVKNENLYDNILTRSKLKDQNSEELNNVLSNCEDGPQTHHDIEEVMLVADEKIKNIPETPEQFNIEKRTPSVQYTISNRGNLQMILNRFMYHLRYSGRGNTHRRWVCVDHENVFKCNAHVITKGDSIVRRLGAHTHPFHDSKILKKMKTTAVFSAIKRAEEEKKNSKSSSGQDILSARS